MSKFLSDVAVGVTVGLVLLALPWLGIHTLLLPDAVERVFDLVTKSPKAVLTTRLFLFALAALSFFAVLLVSYFRSDSYRLRKRRKFLAHERRMAPINQASKEALEILLKIGKDKP